MKKQNRFLSLLLCALLLLTMVGCRAANPAQGDSGTTTAPEVHDTTAHLPDDTTADLPDETEETTAPTEPEEQTGPTEETMEYSADVQVVRVQDIPQATVEAIIVQYLPSESDGISMVHLKDRQSLDAFLKLANSEILQERCEMYQDHFFDSYDLIMIPRVTNTGSVTHTVDLVAEGDRLVAVVTAEIPEICTMDMANWFLVVPVEKSETAGKTVSARMANGFGTIFQPITGVVR